MGRSTQCRYTHILSTTCTHTCTVCSMSGWRQRERETACGILAALLLLLSVLLPGSVGYTVWTEREKERAPSLQLLLSRRAAFPRREERERQNDVLTLSIRIPPVTDDVVVLFLSLSAPSLLLLSHSTKKSPKTRTTLLVAEGRRNIRQGERRRRERDREKENHLSCHQSHHQFSRLTVLPVYFTTSFFFFSSPTTTKTRTSGLDHVLVSLFTLSLPPVSLSSSGHNVRALLFLSLPRTSFHPLFCLLCFLSRISSRWNCRN